MPSTLTWLDYSEHDRRRMLDVIQQFGEKATRDELGLGSIRDSFADQLFPGTSTIQTRARYFLFVPWIYRALEEKRVSSAAIPARLRKFETEVMQSLIAAGEESGLVGRRAQGNVQRLPSSIYWQGLATWGLRLFPRSQAEYHQSLDGFHQRRVARRPSRHEFDGESALETTSRHWHPGLPSPPQGFPQQLSFSLTANDAIYLRERILTHCPESLLAHVVRERLDIEEAAFPWDLLPLPRALNETVSHGRSFSEVMHGAQILYNLMLAELRQEPERIDEYETLFSDWASRVTERREVLQAWNVDRFWQLARRGNPRISERCRCFVNRWISLFRGTPEAQLLSKSSAARQLVEHREFELKKGLSRLRNLRARERWQGDSGIGQVDFRWTASKRILTDILQGLESDDHA